MSATQLYRHWDKDSNLLYVGISYCSISRLRQHSKGARWFKLVANVTIEQFNTRKEAEEAELKAIRTENPIYNIVGMLPRELKETTNKIVKRVRWRKPTYKIIGKRFLSPNYISAYKELLYSLELGKEEYISTIDWNILADLQDLIRLSPEIYKQGTTTIMDTLRLILGIYTENGEVKLRMHTKVLTIMITARDSGDIFIEKDYIITSKVFDKTTLQYSVNRMNRVVTSNWYTPNILMEGGKAYQDDLVIIGEQDAN